MIEIVNLLYHLLEDAELNTSDLTIVAKFYESDVSLDLLRSERNIWFQRCSLMGSKLAKEESLKFMMTNLCMLCVIHFCLPVSTWKGKHTDTT